ncbi:molybdopterin-guanine dinucleotide biosynthesis protein B [Heliorestis acidaminivorans]|uniref:Molybdopterin-guanine dinucleotide biosynthesis protein B n=1 Tax=Heliorestis acidaminivorans TaxID=553427 RepID=A0A6I0F3N3_9FIRM|nr:molybdopterin-guanine dinucleotide biosynthesis protein B [Heliorestis acidaminivorans]KAB2954571.1 molybdopterin-guanine dinucleotide biosynthesis protein B [Heliorestis acidaminivorans]
MNKIPVLSIVGTSNSGKTTLLEKIIVEMKKRGYRIATVKHSHHDAEIDRPGKDTWRHGQAGADKVVLSTPTKVAIIEKLAEEVALEQILERISGVDIIFTEGYKRGSQKKIEVHRTCLGRGLITPLEELIAIASDQTFEVPVPSLDLNDIEGLTKIIEQYIENENKK